MGMPVTDWIGGGVSGTGAGMQFMAQGKRERAQNRVAEAMRAETARYGQERFDVSENLRKALEAVSMLRGETTQQYFDRRNSPERQLEGDRVRDAQVAAGQGGLDRALSALRGPDRSYQPPGSTVSAPDAVMGAPVPQGTAYDRSMSVYGGHQNELLANLMAEIAARGHLSGVAGFDTGNEQQLALGLRPLENEMFLRQLLTGVRQGEAQFAHNNAMAQLGQDMEYANRVGSTEMLVGSILQNIGAGISGSGNFQYQSANGGKVDPAAGAPEVRPATDAQVNAYMSSQAQLAAPGSSPSDYPAGGADDPSGYRN